MFRIDPEHLSALEASLAPHLARHIRPHVRAAINELVNTSGTGRDNEAEPEVTQDDVVGDDGFCDEDGCEDGLGQTDVDRIMRHANETRQSYRDAAEALGLDNCQLYYN